MHQLELYRRRLQGVEIIRLVGAVEPSSSASLFAVLNKLISEGSPCIILECRDVAHFGSAELKRLLDFAHYARAQGGDLKCVGLSLTVQHVANLIANGDLMDCHDETTSALAAFRNSHVPALV
jgi:anti-anti-sigma regulatory factor